MTSESQLASHSNGRNEFLALSVFLFCTTCSIILIPTSFWGMIRLEMTHAEIFLGTLLTFTLSILMMCGSGMVYLFVKNRPAPVRVAATRRSFR
jgi:spore maturation protein SpmA